MTKGWAALADSYKARMNRLGARHMRGIASLYSTEHQCVQEMYEEAKRLEEEAKFYEKRIGKE